MSQWGAYGLAQKGWPHRRILTHFYSHTRVVASSTLPKKVRVGLTAAVRRCLGARSGPVQLWLDGPGQTFVAKIPSGKTWTVSAAPAVRKYTIATTRAPWSEGSGGEVLPDRCSPPSPGRAPGVVPRSRRGLASGIRAYAYGFLEFDLTGCADRCVERLTIELPFEAYLRGMGEMPSSWPTAALRTQAVAARTFATYKIKRTGPERLRLSSPRWLRRPGLRRVEQGERARWRPMGRRGGRHPQEVVTYRDR